MLRSVVRRGRFSPPPLSNSPYVCLFCHRDPVSRYTRQLSSSTVKYSTTTTTNRKGSKEAIFAQNAQLLNAIKGEVESQRSKKEKQQSKKSYKAASQSAGKKVKVKVKKSGKSKRAKPTGIPGVSISSAMQRRGTVIDSAMGLNPDDVVLEPIHVPGQPAVPRLSHNLDKVLFNPGVYHLQDPRSRVFNFDPYLQKIMPVSEFDFGAVASYITSSRDVKLENLAKKLKKKYIGSTSSMTTVLQHFHYLLSSWRSINTEMLSKSFSVEYKTFTQLSRVPAAIFLRWKGDGTYAIDPDKEFDSDSILSLLGRSMEKLLTLPPEIFEKYRRSNSHILEPEDRKLLDTYNYTTMGDFLMRSQLDAQDPRLPGSGMFDLKTRAVVSVRMDVANFHLGSGYQIKSRIGQWESFEREYFDMIRAAFLKYSLQVRMGRMDGIFVAFHNTEKIFGFQYVSLDEMDSTLHEGPGSGIGEKEFKLSLQLLNKILNKATEKYPGKSLRLHFETRETQTPYMYIFAEPVSEENIEEIQASKKQDMAEFLKSLDEKRTRLERKAELKAVAENFGTIENEETDTTPPSPKDPGEVLAVSEDAVVEKAVDSVSGSKVEGVVLAVEDDVLEADDTEKIVQGNDEEGEEEEVVEEEVEEGEGEEGEGEEVEEDSSEPDEEFLDKLVEQAAKPEGEDLLSMTLTTKNYVNGVSVLRPLRLTPADKWEVEYSIAEAKTQERGWSTYKALKERRRKFSQSRLVSEDGEVASGYVMHLRNIASMGRKWADEQSTLHAGKKAVVYENQKDGGG